MWTGCWPCCASSAPRRLASDDLTNRRSALTIAHWFGGGFNGSTADQLALLDEGSVTVVLVSPNNGLPHVALVERHNGGFTFIETQGRQRPLLIRFDPAGPLPAPLVGGLGLIVRNGGLAQLAPQGSPGTSPVRFAPTSSGTVLVTNPGTFAAVIDPPHGNTPGMRRTFDRLGEMAGPVPELTMAIDHDPDAFGRTGRPGNSFTDERPVVPLTPEQQRWLDESGRVAEPMPADDGSWFASVIRMAGDHGGASPAIDRVAAAEPNGLRAMLARRLRADRGRYEQFATSPADLDAFLQALEAGALVHGTAARADAGPGGRAARFARGDRRARWHTGGGQSAGRAGPAHCPCRTLLPAGAPGRQLRWPLRSPPRPPSRSTRTVPMAC